MAAQTAALGTRTVATMAEPRAAIPAYVRPTFVVDVYRASFVIGAGAVIAASIAGLAAGVSMAIGVAVSVLSFWALERTLATTYGRPSHRASWGAVGLAVAKYAFIAVALLTATRVEFVSMGLVATGLVVVYAAVVAAATRDMIRRRAADRLAAGSKDLV